VSPVCVCRREWSDQDLDSSGVLHEMWATRLRVAMDARRHFQEEEEVLLDEELEEHSGPIAAEVASIDPKSVTPEISFKESDKSFLAAIGTSLHLNFPSTSFV
jgi:hypothetical protein